MCTIKEFREKYGIAFTTRHNGKMEGMASLSTSVLLNPRCKARAAVKGSICEKCYAASMANCYKPLARCLENNTRVLTSQIIPVNDWPLVNYSIFRLEAFGDLINTTQVINYFNFCRRNPHTIFALWTKNADIIAAALETEKKPRNLILIESSLMLNKETAPHCAAVDKVFTVYDAQTIDGEGIKINCGARCCATCRRCYSKKRGVEKISERLHK